MLTVHNGPGGVILSSRNDSQELGGVRIIVAVGKTFETANAACIYHARKMSRW